MSRVWELTTGWVISPSQGRYLHRTHTHTHTHTKLRGLRCRPNDRRLSAKLVPTFVDRGATWIEKILKSVPWMVFEPTILAFLRAKTFHVLHQVATGVTQSWRRIV
jgi:hypothetical protein